MRGRHEKGFFFGLEKYRKNGTDGIESMMYVVPVEETT